MKLKAAPRDFLVYAHHKATTGEVFYIGKGDLRRAHSGRGRTRLWRSVVAKHGLVVKIVQSGLQEWAAFELELDLIALHGRIDLGSGPLVNFTDGGEGIVGLIRTEAHKQKISMAASAQWMDQEARKSLSVKAKNRWTNAEWREKSCKAMSKAHQGKILSESHKANIAQGNKGKAKSESHKAAIGAGHSVGVVCIDMEKAFSSFQEAKHWLRANGSPKASDSALVAACKGKYKSAYGYRWQYAQGVAA